MIVPPGSTIGILGGGQLGRMLAIAAAQLGYRTHIYAPEASGPATEVAAGWTRAGYDDLQALDRFAEAVDAVTYEFENVKAESVERLAGRVPTHPSAASLRITGHRPAEKAFVERLGGRAAAWRPADSLDTLHAALREIGTPAILKTASEGYDGKGQARIDRPDHADEAWSAIGERPAIVERRIDFDAEFSVIVCRAADGRTVSWDVPENRHEGGILRHSAVPASAAVARHVEEATALARAVADALDHVGVLTLEFFACAEGPLFNEMAPRVHNSGHWTIEGAVTSQFENHVRALCGLRLGSTERTAARVEMRNLLGDEAAGWAAILAEPAAHLHLYGKTESRPGRKMGHVTRVG